jgi:predicted kinase
MRGLPGSGKSTHVKEQIRGLPNKYVVLSTDDVVSANGVYLWSPEMIKESHHVNQIKCKTAMKKGIEYIVIDNTNTTWNEIQPYVQLAKECKYSVDIFEPKTDWKFNSEECFKRNTHQVPLKSIESMLRRWESTEDIKEKVNEYLV